VAVRDGCPLIFSAFYSLFSPTIFSCLLASCARFSSFFALSSRVQPVQAFPVTLCLDRPIFPWGPSFIQLTPFAGCQNYSFPPFLDFSRPVGPLDFLICLHAVSAFLWFNALNSPPFSYASPFHSTHVVLASCEQMFLDPLMQVRTFPASSRFTSPTPPVPWPLSPSPIFFTQTTVD